MWTECKSYTQTYFALTEPLTKAGPSILVQLGNVPDPSSPSGIRYTSEWTCDEQMQCKEIVLRPDASGFTDGLKRKVGGNAPMLPMHPLYRYRRHRCAAVVSVA